MSKATNLINAFENNEDIHTRTAADILKKAMVEIYREFNKRSLKSKMLIQVHDELVFNVLNDEIDEVSEIVRDIMENTFKIDVPLKVDIEIGNNWYEAK